MLRLIEDRMKDDDETTATQLVKLLEDQGYQISKTTVIRARRTLGWTFHGSRYCQMIRDKNKEKRVTWATENFGNDFKDVVWTDESMIQLENHRTFSYRKVNAAPKPKARPKNPYKVMVWAGYIEKRSHKYLSSQRFSRQCGLSRSSSDPSSAISGKCSSAR